MYTYERYNFRIITLLLVILVIVFLVYATYLGAIISAALGVLLSFSYQGTKIDGENKRFIRYDRFLMITIGRWESLPTPSYVTIVRINLSSERTVPGPLVMPENKKGAKAYKVNLVVEHEMRYIPVCRGPIDKMKEEAIRLGKTLGIRVLDFTTHEKHWIL
jgi:hypothetical protein